MIDNLDSMSAEDMRSMLIAKDEMVRELEQAIKDMQSDAESKLTESKDDDESEKMAEESEPESEKMTEEEDEKKSTAMSERVMLSEVHKLREANNKLSKRLEAIESEKQAIEAREAVGALLRDGRITPHEESVAHDAWQMRELQPSFWQLFSERPANSSVPLTQVGHGASGAQITKATLDAEIKQLQAEKSLTYSEALTQFQRSNPDYYAQAFGG
jgi:hypothetical protein